MPAPPNVHPRLDEADERYLARFDPVFRLARRYHQHEVRGFETFPAEGPVLVAVNHSLATYDVMLLHFALRKSTGRVAAGLGDDKLFALPGVRNLLLEGGVVPANPDNGRALLERGRVILVAPGGMRESLRPGEERYCVRWDKRKGFVRLAIQTGSPIVLAACPDADRIFHVYENALTKLAYKRFHLPLPLARGWGPTLVPRPVVLTHHLSEPLAPPAYDPSEGSARLEKLVEAWHPEVHRRMNELMREATHARDA